MKWVKYLIVFLIPTLIVLMYVNYIDNDSWYVLAQGRQIAEHGVYYEDMLSMHEGLHSVAQNYAFSVVFYYIHSLLGAPGIYATMLILNILIIFLIYRICMVLSDKNTTLSLIIASVTDFLLAFGFITTRAQMLDYVVFLALIYILELFLKTNKVKYLWWIPGLSLLMANFHASVWWMLFAMMFVYALDMLVRPKKRRIKYKWKTYIGVFLISLALGVVNPYGIEMIIFIFKCYQGLASLNFVYELKAFSPLAGNNLIIYMGILAAIGLYIYGKRKIYLRHLLLFMAFLTMGLLSLKGMSELILIMFIPLAFIYKDLKIPQVFNVPKIGQIILGWTGLCVVMVTLPVMVWTLGNLSDYPSLEMKTIMNVIDEKTEGMNKKDLKIYVGYNQGGYVEYRGYPAYLDPRGGDFIKAINGKEDILSEWTDLREGRLEMSEFLSKYNFDFLVVDKYGDGIPADKIDERYTLVYGGEEAPFSLFEKVQAS